MLLDIGLTVEAPIVKNPEPDWLAEREGIHFEALRLFHEACWAWAALRSQSTRPFASVRWETTIASRGDLFDYALDCRSQAFLKGFFLMTADHIAELMALPDLNANQQKIVERFLALCDRHAVTHDLYNQPLPAPLYDLLATIEKAPPFKTQGNCALTKRFRLRKKAYFAKLTDEVLSGMPPAGYDELHEVSCAHALAALQPGLGPSAAFHVIAADGRQCSVLAEVAGKTYRESQAAKVAALVDVQWLQWIVLAEWLFGIQDRHFRNLLVDKETHRAAIIDMAFAWRIDWKFLGWNEDDPPLRFCESYARAIWEQNDSHLTFLRALLSEACAREAAIIEAVMPFLLPADILFKMKRQFAIVRAILNETTGDIRLAALEQKAHIWYTQGESSSKDTKKDGSRS